MGLIKLILDVRNIENCGNCNFVDVCANNTDLKHRDLPPLSKRGEQRVCFVCAHSYWNINRAEGKRTCMTQGCGEVRYLNNDSVKIIHQR